MKQQIAKTLRRAAQWFDPAPTWQDRIADGLAGTAPKLPNMAAATKPKRVKLLDRLIDRIADRVYSRRPGPTLTVNNVHSIRNGETFAERHPELFTDQKRAK